MASGVGAVLTVVFSWRARSAARAAEIASRSTREKLQSIDNLSELSRLNGRVDDLMLRLENGTWELVAERATDLRVSLAAVAADLTDVAPQDVQDRLILAVTQFKNIAAGASKASFDKNNFPNISRYQRIVADQKETSVLATQFVKTHMGDA